MSQAPIPPPPPSAPAKKSSNVPMVIGISFGVFCLCGGGILAALGYYLVPIVAEAPTRGQVSRVRSDLRSLAVGLETYWIDNNSYPVYTTDHLMTPNANLPGSSTLLEPTFASPPIGGHVGLTTPIAYITELWADPFGEPWGRTFSYYTDGKGWIMWSLGPDRVNDLDWTVYNGDDPDILLKLLPYAYDPTNGMISGGDVFRIKQ